MSDEKIVPTEIDVRSVVRWRYGKLAGAAQGESCCASVETTCCGPAEGSARQLDAVARLYDDPEAVALPPEVTALSLGCGNPVALASLQPGQTILDLGSGGGIDCFLAARKVGPRGSVIGVDMTPEMIERARANRDKLGLNNVSFRLGEIEHLPVADNSVDVILSNCVINLSPDKVQTFREAFRVLKPSGKLAVTDIVTDGPLPAAVKESMSAWTGCVAGALEVSDYVAALEEAGFVDVTLTPVFWEDELVEAAATQLDPAVVDALPQTERAHLEQADPGALGRAVFSAQITARKPD